MVAHSASVIFWPPADAPDRDPVRARLRAASMSDHELTPAELVARIQAGDRAAENELVRRYCRGVRTLISCNSRSTDEPDDILQDTFLMVISKIRRRELRSADKLAAFIHGVARNLVTTHYRQERPHHSSLEGPILETLAAESESPLELADRDQALGYLHEAIASLPVQRDRTLLNRYFFDHADVDQLCAELGTDRRHFSRVKHRATRRLIEQIRGQSGP